MGTWVLLLPLLFAAEAQAQAQVCSVDKTSLTVKENTNPGEPLLDIYVPQGQQVTLGPSSTLFAFRIQGNQLFLNVTPDYEANTMLLAHLECRSGDSVARSCPPRASTWGLVSSIFQRVLDSPRGPAQPRARQEKYSLQ